MKKILTSLFVLVLLAGCLPNPGSPSAPTAQPSPTAYPVQPTYTPYPTEQQVSATESATPQVLPSATLVPATLGVAADNGTPQCQNHGVTAWQNDNQLSGESYGEAPVGGLDEVCWVVAQTWWVDSNGTSHRAVFAVAPHTVAWLSGHKGGTGWYFGGSLADVKANLAEQSRQLLERDGEMDTLTIILPDDAAKFPILTRFSQKQ